MRYDFDQVLDRQGTDSVKWDSVESIFGASDVLPMWVADMDFPVARPILDAIRRRLDHAIFGYTTAGASLREAVVDRLRRKYDWQIDPDWLVFTPGVVPALTAAVKAIAAPGDEIVIQSPVYYPFWDAIRTNGCLPVNNPLRCEAGRYAMDPAGLERALGPRDGMTPSPSRVKALMISNPHNPVGRVWSEDELVAAGRLAIDNGAIVLSDEIHCELLFQGHRHVPFGSICGEFAMNSMVFMAPSKTFNLAGLSASVVIVPNPALRSRFSSIAATCMGLVNALGLAAFEAAYREGDEWLSQLLEYLQGNLEFVLRTLSERIPRVTAIRPEGTYLVWLDFRSLGMDPLRLRDFLRKEARVGLDDGYVFGPEGEGFQRMNIACPRALLKEGLDRIARAVQRL